ncbi:hypothetical protein [Gordonia zhaorongruii]|uniref:hypothetical protein n=1 Tax=Gordonia zhaorongruii TaxID=2597659 RepID=UPI001044B426|nr:hypothetical protein [Gordonia zhaorongruii]
MFPTQYPDSQPDSHPPQKRGPGARRFLVAAVVASVVALAGGTGGYFIGANGSDAPGVSTATAEPAAYTGSATTSTSPTPVTPDDFILSVLVEEKRCFGSAGCNVTFSVTPTFMSSLSVLDGRSFKVLFEVSGTTDTVFEKFTLTGNDMLIDSSLSAQVDTSESEITAHVTQVVETTTY